MFAESIFFSVLKRCSEYVPPYVIHCAGSFAAFVRRAAVTFAAPRDEAATPSFSAQQARTVAAANSDLRRVCVRMIMSPLDSLDASVGQLSRPGRDLRGHIDGVVQAVDRPMPVRSRIVRGRKARFRQVREVVRSLVLHQQAAA